MKFEVTQYTTTHDEYRYVCHYYQNEGWCVFRQLKSLESEALEFLGKDGSFNPFSFNKRQIFETGEQAKKAVELACL